MPQKVAIIIGAGPAGLTAAFELLERAAIKPVILEQSSEIGGLSKTINYKGNRIDIGGHRFFSKSDRVMNWWRAMLPIQGQATRELVITYQNQSRTVPGSRDGPDPRQVDRVMLICSRLSRIFHRRNLFRYPLSLSLETIRNLGFIRTAKVLGSYLKAALWPIRNERTLEDFLINRFGAELYRTFFKDYTEKVWGTTCAEIPAEWGAQRIKNLSIGRAIRNAIRSKGRRDSDPGQKQTETSLIEHFLYPKFGPGQMWEETARRVLAKGGEVHRQCQVRSLKVVDGRVRSVTIFNQATNALQEYAGDYFFSSMPIKDLIAAMEGDPVPAEVQAVARGLLYRDFVTVGVLLKKLSVRTRGDQTPRDTLPDNWIYIQESDVKLGRLQIYNNWSPFMVNSSDTTWLGLEYFCNEGDELWQMTDAALARFAIDELVKIDFVAREDVLDSTVIRTTKSYPAYFGTYGRFHRIREHLDRIDNLFPIGRNGMHKYNNADHSMLTAMTAVDNIVNGVRSKANIWLVNTEAEFHEENANPAKSGSAGGGQPR